MPKPRKGEKREDFVSRCIPIVMKEGTAKDNKQATAICFSMFKQHKKKKMMNEDTPVIKEFAIANLDFRELRQEKLQGKIYNVAPIVLMTEGVHSGSKGPVFYPAEELKKYSPAWDHKPILIDHPKEGSWAGTDPDVIENQGVGFLLRTRYDTKQRTEGWFDAELTKKKCPALQNAIVNRLTMEVSTGLIADAEEEEGEFGGVKYEFTARNHRPDHLAILVDKIGACSVEKGGGLWQLNESVENKMSHSEVHQHISAALRDELGDKWDGFISDIFDKDFVYWEGGDLLRQKYTKSGDQIEFAGPPEKVERKVEYKVVSNSVSSKEPYMAKTRKELVDAVIANKSNKWQEKHRDKLMKMTDEDLDLFIPDEVAPIANQEELDEAARKGAGKDNVDPPKAKTEVKNEAPKEEKELTEKDWLDKAPPRIRNAFKDVLNFQSTEKSRLITSILNTDKGKETYEKSELEDMELNSLRKIEKIVTPDVVQDEAFANFLGMSPVTNTAQIKNKKPEPMSLPDYDAAYASLNKG